MRGIRWLLLACVAAGCGLDSIPAAPTEPTATASDASAPGVDAGSDVHHEAEAGQPKDAGGDSTTQGGKDVYIPPLGDDGSNPQGEAGADEGTDGDDGGGSVFPSGATLLQPGQAYFFAMTSDGYLIYDSANMDGTYTLGAQKLSGGATTTIISDFDIGGGYSVLVGQTSPLFLSWDSCDSNAICRMTAWSALTGTHTLPATFGCQGAISPDGTNVMYLAAPNANGTVASVFQASSDLSTQNVLEANVGISQAAGGSCSNTTPGLLGTCFMSLGFAGGNAIVASCPPGDPNATIDAFTAPFTPAQRTNLATEVLATSSEPVWSTSADGSLLFAIPSALGTCGGSSSSVNSSWPCVVSTSTGAPAAIQSVLGTGSATAGGLTADGTAVYLNGNVFTGQYYYGGLLSVSLLDSSVTSLTYGADRIIGFTDSTVVFDTREQVEGGTDTNLFAVTYAGGSTTPQTLTTQTSGAFVGFTTDGSQIIYATGYSYSYNYIVGYYVGTGTLNASAVSGSAAADSGLAAQRVLQQNVAYVSMGQGSQLVFQDFFANLFFVDLSTPNPPQLLVSGAVFGDFGLSATLTTLLFSYQGVDAQPGVYALALP